MDSYARLEQVEQTQINFTNKGKTALATWGVFGFPLALGGSLVAGTTSEFAVGAVLLSVPTTIGLFEYVHHRYIRDED